MQTARKNSDFDFSVFLHNLVRILPRLLWLPLLLAVLAGGYRFYSLRRSYNPVYETFAVYRVSASSMSGVDLGTKG